MSIESYTNMWKVKADNKMTAKGQQNDTNKNVKNDKNVKEYIPYTNPRKSESRLNQQNMEHHL